jgi:hypothetical protein
MKTDAELKALLVGAPEAGTVWVHHRGGEYAVVCCSLDEPTHTPLITYRSLKGGPTWTRTLANWRELVALADGRQVPRFSPYQNDHAEFWD